MHKILIAEADTETRESYAWMVNNLGHETVHCEDAIALLDLATSEHDVDMVVMNEALPGASPEHLLSVLKGLHALRDVPILVGSRHKTHADLMKLLGGGATRWFECPADPVELAQAIEEDLQTRRFIHKMQGKTQKVLVAAGPTSSWLLD